MTLDPDSRVRLETFADRVTLAESLAERIAAMLTRDIASSGRASLAISGGTTPMRFLAALSAQAVPWGKVDVTLVDERWVPESSASSNAAMIGPLLLQGGAKAARFIPLFTGHARPEDALDYLERLLGRLTWPLTAAVLGMGEDGHTASFFSGGDRLAEAVDPLAKRFVVPINAPGLAYPRITLTLPVLLSAKNLILHIEGEAKHRVLERALEHGPDEDLPMRAVLRHAGHLDIVWAP